MRRPNSLQDPSISFSRPRWVYTIWATPSFPVRCRRRGGVSGIVSDHRLAAPMLAPLHAPNPPGTEPLGLTSQARRPVVECHLERGLPTSCTRFGHQGKLGSGRNWRLWLSSGSSHRRFGRASLRSGSGWYWYWSLSGRGWCGCGLWFWMHEFKVVVRCPALFVSSLH
jgi:hypothetical protein